MGLISKLLSMILRYNVLALRFIINLYLNDKHEEFVQVEKWNSNLTRPSSREFTINT